MNHLGSTLVLALIRSTAVAVARYDDWYETDLLAVRN
jgi:hypothetical protein